MTKAKEKEIFEMAIKDKEKKKLIKYVFISQQDVKHIIKDLIKRCAV